MKISCQIRWGIPVDRITVGLNIISYYFHVSFSVFFQVHVFVKLIPHSFVERYCLIHVTQFLCVLIIRQFIANVAVYASRLTSSQLVSIQCKSRRNQ